MRISDWSSDVCSSDLRRVAVYDKDREGHYNLISALHKSLRGSDPQAALYYLARMLVAGAEPLYVLRRIVRFASEDIGLADPQALDRKSVVEGKSVSVRVDLGGPRTIKKKNEQRIKT